MDLEKIIEQLKNEGDRMYCNALDLAYKNCRGAEYKLENGKFGNDDLKWHCQHHEMIGQHRGMYHAINLLRSLQPAPPQADTPIKGAGDLKPYFIARLENLRSEYAHENGTVEADTGYFLAKDEHAESYLEGIDRCIELLQDTASSQNSNFCGFPLVMDYSLPPEVIEIRAHNGEVLAHILLDDVKEIAGNGY